MPADWNIQSRAPSCRVCNEPFYDRQACHTLLRFESAGYQRMDLCETCFQKQAPGHAVYSSWKGEYRVPPPPAQHTARKEDVESLLRRLIDRQNPGDVPMIFVLAVMLERKRIIVERDIHTLPDGTRQYVYEHRKSGDTLIVSDPDLQFDDVDELEKEVVHRLALPGAEASDEKSRDGNPGGPGN